MQSNHSESHPMTHSKTAPRASKSSPDRQHAMSMSLEDYLECISMIIREGRPARICDIAAALNVKTPSVVNGIRQLKKLGYVTQLPYKNVELTDAGRRHSLEILDHHELLTGFLKSLGVPPDIAEDDACRMEHILSPETYSAIRRFLDPS